jgi:hypothetical protein
MTAPAGAAAWAAIGAAWLLGAFGGGWLLARLAHRLHPGLAFYKLWATFSALLSGAVALILGLGVVRL